MTEATAVSGTRGRGLLAALTLVATVSTVVASVAVAGPRLPFLATVAYLGLSAGALKWPEALTAQVVVGVLFCWQVIGASESALLAAPVVALAVATAELAGVHARSAWTTNGVGARALVGVVRDATVAAAVFVAALMVTALPVPSSAVATALAVMAFVLLAVVLVRVQGLVRS